MRELAGQYTIVIVTHNMQQAARVASETASCCSVMVEFGPTLTVFENPKDKRTENYVSGRYG